MKKDSGVPPQLEIKEGIQGKGVFAKKDFRKGDVIFTMKGKIISHPTRTSVQIGEHQHIEDFTAGHINHSCTPNIKVNRKKHQFECIEAIQAGEEIMFNYQENEDSLANPFYCECCGQIIIGKKQAEKLKKKRNKAFHLTENTLK